MLNLIRNKRAVSTVIATILMIMVVMVGMGVAFASVVVYSESYQDGVGSAVLEFLTIENVWQDTSGIHIWVYNAGTERNLGTDVDIQVTTIYVDDLNLTNNRADANGNPTIYFNCFSDEIVKAGMHLEFTGHLHSPLANGWHQVTVVTTRGSNFKASFEVP
jgi:FlaG/FlaF family flagellin (archaellin)